MLILNSCTLRSWQWSDRTSLQLHANNRNVSINLRDRFPWPYTQSEADDFLHISTFEPLTLYAAIDINGEAVGGIGIEPFDDVNRYGCEIGYWLSERYWNKGIMTEVVAAYSNYIFENTEFVRLEAHVFGWNRGSGKVLEKCGFEFEGAHRKACFKDGKWCDMIIYAKVR